MTPPRIVALMILAAVLVGWALLAVYLWLNLSSPTNTVLHDTYFVVAAARYLAVQLAIPLVPAGLAALFASPEGWSRRWTSVGIRTLLVAALMILVSVAVDAAFQTTLRGTWMPRRLEPDPMIQFMIATYWLQALGGITAVAGLVFALVGTLVGKPKP